MGEGTLATAVGRVVGTALGTAVAGLAEGVAGWGEGVLDLSGGVVASGPAVVIATSGVGVLSAVIPSERASHIPPSTQAISRVSAPRPIPA